MLNRDNYFEHGNNPAQPVISSSILKLIRPGDGGSIEKLEHYLENYDSIQEERKYNFSLEYGTLLHKYLEDPSAFAIADFARPSEAVVDIVTAVFEMNLSSVGGQYSHVKPLEDSGDLIVTVAESYGWQPRWGAEAKVKNILKDGLEYYEFLREKGDAHVLNEKEHEVLTNVIDKWVTSNHYPQDNQINWTKEIPISWEQVTMWGRVECKSLLDKLHIHYDTNNIIIEDVKTTRSIEGFISRLDTRMNKGSGKPEIVHIPGPFVNYKYYRQLAFYRRALRYMLQQDGHNPSEFNIKCRILAFENQAPYRIRLYEAPEEWLSAGDEEIDEAFAELKFYHEQYAESF